MVDQAGDFPFKIFRFRPGWRDAVPFIAWLVLAGMLQISRIAGSQAGLILEWLAPISDLGFIVMPLLWVRLVDREKPSFLGLSRYRIWWAVGLGVPLGLLAAWLVVSSSVLVGEIPFFPPLLKTIAYILGAIFHVAALEFFYRGWVSAALERSYGFGIALLGAGVLYAFSPLILWGTDPTVPSVFLSPGYYWTVVFPSNLFMGVLLSGIARLTRNLLAPFLIMLPQTILTDLLPGGGAHAIGNPVSHLVGTLALAGIVAVVFWLTRLPHRNLSSLQEPDS